MSRRKAELNALKDGNLGQLLLKAARLYHEQSMDRLRHKGYTVSAAHLALLPHLDLDGTRMNVLAGRMGITKQGINQLVTEMERHGYLTRIPDPADARARLVILTEKGFRGVKDGLATLKLKEAQLQAGLGFATLRDLKHTLARLVELLEEEQDSSPGTRR
jgi:DNA-binding MarR family transcriptional regulator